MHAISIKLRRILIRDFVEEDRPAFLTYQTDQRYRELYNYDPALERPNKLFGLFIDWQHETPRRNMQFAILDSASGRLLGSCGLRKVNDAVAVFGIELSPAEWGRFRLALDASDALIRYGFETLNLEKIIGDTASGNRRVEKLARWFGAEIVIRRRGPGWMEARGWQEVEWEITRLRWKQAPRRR